MDTSQRDQFTLLSHIFSTALGAVSLVKNKNKNK